jgi:hypothetical protein
VAKKVEFSETAFVQKSNKADFKIKFLLQQQKLKYVVMQRLERFIYSKKSKSFTWGCGQKV